LNPCFDSSKKQFFGGIKELGFDFTPNGSIGFLQSFYILLNFELNLSSSCWKRVYFLLLMDTVSNKDSNANANGCMNKPVDVASLDCKKIEDHVNGKNDCDSNSKRGGIARKLNKTCRRVQWNDTLGKKLVEVLEYELR
jgi:hypothetical protein